MSNKTITEYRRNGKTIQTRVTEINDEGVRTHKMESKSFESINEAKKHNRLELNGKALRVWQNKTAWF